MHSISDINSMQPEQFVRVIGPVFEHSPWIAETGAALRPFANIEILHATLCDIVATAPRERQIALIMAHPDLVGRAALQGTLTAESTREQISAGLGCLTQDEIKLFQNLNAAYGQKFGFPFVICARLNKKEAILSGFRSRLNNDRDSEIWKALDEISKIALLRLQDIVQP